MAPDGALTDTATALALSEAVFRLIVETANEGIWLVNREAQTILVNGRMAELLGTTADAMNGRTVLEFCFPEDVPLAQERIGRNLEGQNEQFDFRFRRSDGRPVLVLACTSPVRDGQGAVAGALGMFTDITERKRAEAALLESQQRYQDVFEHAGDVVYTLDLQGKITAINRKAEDLTGYSREELLGTSIRSLIAPEDLERSEQMFTRKLSGEQETTYEIRLRARDGGLRSLEVSSRLLYQDGAPVGIHGIARDITLRKLMEEALRRSHDQLEAVLRSVADGITVQDPSGRLVYANDAAAQLLGYPSGPSLLEAPLGSVVRNFAVTDEDGHAFSLERLPGRRALQGETPEALVLRFRSAASGEERWSLVRALPVFDADGRVAFAVNAFQDVTAMKQREAKQRFLLEAGPLLYGSLDYSTTLARVAELAVPALADWAAVDIVDEDGAVQRLAIAHQDPARVDLVRELEEHYPTPPDAEHGLPGVLRSGRSEAYFEITDELIEASAVDADHLRLVRSLELRSLMIVPLVARGRTLGAMSLAYAESGRQYGAEDLALVEDLAQRAALAIDNARLYQEAQSALQVRDSFLSAVSHDLRTPLTAIIGIAQLLLRQAGRSEALQSDLVVRSLSQVTQASERMRQMIEELLDLSRLEAGRELDLMLQPVDLLQLTRQIVEEQPAAERGRIAIEATAPALMGQWDEARLERVVANLLSNAVKYSPDGGEIRVTLAEEADPATGEAWLELKVQDHGLGIPEADLPRVFERFRRGANVQSSIAGIGLGLASAKQIVEQHGGTIAIKSVEGSGTLVTVRLPGAPPGDVVKTKESR